MNDADLVKAFLRGDREAFSELVQRHARPLTLMILKIVRDPEEAKDISQIAFLKAYEALPRFLNSSSFKTWLYRIALNTVRDHLRKFKPVVVPDGAREVVDSREPASDLLDRARFTERMRRAVEELPEKQRVTLQLRVYEGMEYGEIAEIMGGTTGGARANFFQATKTLREKLGPLL